MSWGKWKKFLLISGVAILSFYMLIGLYLVYGWYRSDDYRAVGVPILNYHQVNNERKGPLTMTVEDFRWQMKYLKEQGFHTISPKELEDYLLYGKALPSKPIMITFDDGYEDNYTNAYPILKEYGMHATIFMVAHSVDLPGHLTKEQLRIMVQNGITIGTHTYSHRRLTDLSDEAIGNEITNSRNILEGIIGKPVVYLAYPEGYVDNRVASIVKAKGINLGFTIDMGRAEVGQNPLWLPRIPFLEGIEMKKRFKARIYCTEAVTNLVKLRKYLQEHNLDGLTVYLPHL